MIFWILAGAGTLLLAASLVFDGLFDSIDLGGDWLSASVVGGFLAAFGFFGGVLTANGLPLAASSVLALACGALFGLGTGLLTRTLNRGGAGGAYTHTDLVGQPGVVVTDITPGSFGEVTVSVRGIPTKLNARAETHLTAGTGVTVTGVLTATSVNVAPSAT